MRLPRERLGFTLSQASDRVATHEAGSIYAKNGNPAGRPSMRIGGHSGKNSGPLRGSGLGNRGRHGFSRMIRTYRFEPPKSLASEIRFSNQIFDRNEMCCVLPLVTKSLTLPWTKRQRIFNPYHHLPHHRIMTIM